MPQNNSLNNNIKQAKKESIIFPQWVFLPGTAFWQNKKYYRALLIFLLALLIFLSIIFLIFSPIIAFICGGACSIFFQKYIIISDPYALNSIIFLSWGARLSWLLLLAFSFVYLIYINIQYYLYQREIYELDKKISPFQNSLFTSFLLQFSLILTFLLYGILYLKPIEREMPLEMIFVNNTLSEPIPDEKIKSPILSNKKAIDKGQIQNKKDKLINGQINKEKIIDNQKKQKMADKNKQSKPTSPPTNPSKAQKENKPQEEKKQSRAEKIEKVEKVKKTENNNDNNADQYKPKLKEIQKNINKNQQSEQNQKANPSQKPRQNSPYSNNTPSPILNNKSSSEASSSPTVNSNSRKNNNANTNTIESNHSLVDYASYTRHIEAIIHQYWKPVNDNSPDLTSVKFLITKEGKLIPNSIKILNSNSKASEKQAIDAILRASTHFRALPEGSAEIININFTFREE